MLVTERTFVVNRPTEAVLSYLQDFAHAEEWDPGTVTCTQRTPGPVAVGTVWDNVTSVLGRKTQIDYRLTVLEPHRVVFVGKNKASQSTDDIRIMPRDGGSSTITYRSEIVFHGPWVVFQYLLKPVFNRLGDETRDKITAAVHRLS